MSGLVVLTLVVQADGSDESTRVEIKPRTVLAWEKSYRNRSAAQLSDDAVKFEYLYELAWLSMGKPGDFDSFCADTDVAFAPPAKEAGKEATDSDPTSVAAPTGS